MKVVLLFVSTVAAIILISFGVNHLSEPSNLRVWIGVAEIILALIVVYIPLKNFFQKF